MSYCIYLRKSRADAEAELRGEGETLARHERALTGFARSTGLEVGAVYREIVSGETIAARPQMQRLLAEVSEGMWDGVIVMDIDRLARGNSIDQGIISQTFLFADTKIITPAKTYDPKNEFDEEYFEFGLFMSRREYKTINRRLQRGRLASVKEGKYVSNKAPFGYERIKLKEEKGFTLQPVSGEACIVRNIFEWYTQGIVMPDGTRKPIGVSLIARELNRKQIKAPSGSVWTAQTIRDMLINPVYIGKIRWNARPVRKKMIDGRIIEERPRNNDCMLCDGLHEALVSDDTFALASVKMGKNKSRPIRGDKTINNPLAGLVRCSVCKRRMQRRPNSKCPDLLICPEPTCPNHGSYIHIVEDHIIDVLKGWSNGYIVKGEQSTALMPDTEAMKSELEQIKKSECTIQAQIEKAYDAFETGIYDAATFKTRCEVLNERLRQAQERAVQLLSSIENADQAQRVINEFLPKVKAVTDTYDGISDPERRNSMLAEIIDHIDYIKEVKGRGHEEDFSITVYPRLPKIQT